MKKTFYILAFSLAVSANVMAQEDQGDTQDRIQQEPPREAQRNVEQSATNSEANAQNDATVRQADAKVKRELEKSTGKESENPATNNSKTVRPAVMSDPVSQPIRQTN